MSSNLELRLEPSGRRLVTAAQMPLQDLLFDEGVEFPCGGLGSCGKCRVRVLSGELDATEEDRSLLGEAAVADGWRLACRAVLTQDASLEVAQWEASVLSDDTPMQLVPRKGWGIAIDLGTTTVVAQLVDLATGNVLGVRTGMNPQSAFGTDVMSRIHYAVEGVGRATLTSQIRCFLGKMVQSLCEEAAQGSLGETLREVLLVGNTVMHHLFAGFDVLPLARSPFESPHLAERRFSPGELSWEVPSQCQVRFLPCLGGFIGSDILAGILAAGMNLAGQPQVLIDLGTNGEIVASDGERLLCAATAAGPAFEGARIRFGMRATHGAIDRVKCSSNGKALQCHVIGGESPQGVCGSGLVDAVACGLEAELVAPSGRLYGGTDRLPLADEVYLHQCDVRELQLAKGAIAAGIELLLARLDLTPEEVERVYLCGAFGNYLDKEHARCLGLLPFRSAQVQAMGNTALRGAKLALLTGEATDSRLAEVRQRVEHVSLNEDSAFMDVYVSHMPFPSECV